MAKPRLSPSDLALERVREVCFRFAGTEEKISHGSPWFHVRGKMFVAFVDDHHGDGRLAVWCKATHEDQARLVAEAPDRHFVPPYVGVKGWVGVRLDRPDTDWIELAIIVENAWASIVPKSVAKGPARPPPPSLPRPKTDPAVAQAALAKLEAIAAALPETDVERETRHAILRVAKKVYAYFLDNHHGDGVIGVCVKVDKGEQIDMAEAHPDRFFVPAYIGARGWVGVRVDGKKVDWREVAKLVRASYAKVAPKRLLPL